MNNWIIQIIIFILIIISIIFLNKLSITNYSNNNKENKRLIPSIIFQTYKNKNIPTIIKKRWLKLNPNYKYKFYDNRKCYFFLLKYFGRQYAEVFRFIKNGPIKSDFWRVCILYKYGGIYADIDIIPHIPIDNFVDKDTTLYTCVTDPVLDADNLNPHFIATTPENPLILACVEKYMNDIINTKYSYSGWSITRIMNDILKKYIGTDKFYEGKYKKDNQVLQFSQEICPNKNNIKTCYISQNNINIMNNRDSELYNEKKHKFK